MKLLWSDQLTHELKGQQQEWPGSGPFLLPIPLRASRSRPLPQSTPAWPSPVPSHSLKPQAPLARERHPRFSAPVRGPLAGPPARLHFGPDSAQVN